MRLFFLLIPFYCLSVKGQDLTRIPLSQQDKVDSVMAHYQWENSNGHFGIIDLWLLKAGRYVYEISSNTYNAFSEGAWVQSKDIITLKSEIQKNNLPIKISFRQKNSNDFEVKRIAFLKDLNDSIIFNAFIFVNNDSISCMDGDLLCRGDFNIIKKVRVEYENHGITSQWIDVPPFDGLLQITIQSKKDLSNFIVFSSEKYLVMSDKLKPLVE